MIVTAHCAMVAQLGHKANRRTIEMVRHILVVPGTCGFLTNS